MWSHTSFIFHDSEVLHLDELVSFTPSSGVVVSHTGTILTANDLFTATGSVSGISVVDINGDLTGTFPIEEVRWVEDDLVETSGSDWGAVPAGASPTDFTPNSTRSRTYEVECVCVWNDTSVPPVPHTETIVLPVVVFQDYSANGLLLKQKAAEENPR